MVIVWALTLVISPVRLRVLRGKGVGVGAGVGVAAKREVVSLSESNIRGNAAAKAVMPMPAEITIIKI